MRERKKQKTRRLRTNLVLAPRFVLHQGNIHKSDCFKLRHLKELLGAIFYDLHIMTVLFKETMNISVRLQCRTTNHNVPKYSNCYQLVTNDIDSSYRRDLNSSRFVSDVISTYFIFFRLGTVMRTYQVRILYSISTKQRNDSTH